VIREQLLPLASDLEVVIAIEDVCDGFVTGPSELRRYVDALGSRWVRAGVDLDRLTFFTSPQDGVRTLGPRLVNVRARDVHVAGTLREIAYDGWFTLTA
jgi:hexulose-6-phosphate isomerase